MLAILIATGEKAIEAFQASDNPVDADFVAELERVIERSRTELVTLRQANPKPSEPKEGDDGAGEPAVTPLPSDP